jgi:LysM repeat protein
MQTMTRRIAACAFLATLAFAALFAACGGSSADPNAGKGQPITDPARVRTATPIQNYVTYLIRPDGSISSSGGAPTTSANLGTPTPVPPGSYTVKPNDTCGAIAGKYNITVDALKKANRTIDDGCTNLHEGDILRIPSATPTAAATTPGGTPKPGAKTYTVKAGDTCGSIAAALGVDVSKLISANGIDADCKNLQAGQVLNVPS